jgi:hypothetical protein
VGRSSTRRARRVGDQICSTATTCSSIPLAIVAVFDSELVGFVCFFVCGMLIDPQSAARQRSVTVLFHDDAMFIDSPCYRRCF